MSIEEKVKLTEDLDFVQIASVQGVDKSNEEKNWVVFYCKKCKEIVDVNKIGQKLVFECKKCKSRDISIGTNEWVNQYYKIT